MIDGQKPTFYPMIWFETYTELDDDIKWVISLEKRHFYLESTEIFIICRKLMKLLAIAPFFGVYLGPVFIGLGVLTAIISLTILLRKNMQQFV